jgi:hypothetical protein
MERLTNQALGGQVSSDLLDGVLGKGGGDPEALFAAINLTTA